MVGGAYSDGRGPVEYPLLGLYDDAGRLTDVGRCGVHPHKAEITARIHLFIGGAGFTGDATGGQLSVAAWAPGDTTAP